VTSTVGKQTQVIPFEVVAGSPGLGFTLCTAYSTVVLQVN
jgi:hypothetical protein